jgi:hypothetical protein
MRLTAPQSRVFRSKARFRVLVAGRRFGKTHLAILELLRCAWAPGKLAWYIAPTYKQAKMIAWEKLKSIADPWIVKANETELSVRLVTGGTIRLHGSERYDTLRGPGLDGVVFDEHADIDPRAWTEVIRPMLADRKGGALFIGTPKGFNHFRNMYYGAVGTADDGGDWAGWSGFQFTTIQGGNVTPEEVEAARRDLDERTFRQEFEASFENTFGGRVYYAFDRTQNVQPCSYIPGQPICWTLDFNVSPMCSVIAQMEDVYGGIGRRGSIVHVLDEIALRDSNVWDVCEVFAERTKSWAKRAGILNVQVYGDATGNSREHTGPSSYQMIREFFATKPEYRVSYHQKAKNPAITDRVNAVNAMLCNAEGTRRLAVDPKCKALIQDLDQVAWKMDASGNATGQMDQKGVAPNLPAGLTHISDALGYMIETEFGMHVNGGPRSGYLG